ncbi:ComF family protein [Pseudomonas fluorescens]|uniref:Amidophosphoribosyltransferase n=1 Tax=Pseudomonas fluorescens TaxID=294 RepID=A0A423M4I0_PSEFL|nr:ComF family protein [Pseudomonas fluorescens]RON76882.1 amidophosphoribosyltransferase [Pseudomonas fluorescens]
MRCQPRYEGQVYICLNNVQHCLLCDELAEAEMPICVACETDLPWLGDHCETCALPLPAAGLICDECLLEPPAFEQVVAPWQYGFPVDSLITRFKHNAKWPFGHLLADVLGQYLQHRFDEGLPRPDGLLPVPLANKRLRQRGFNQAAMLARWLSQSLGLPCEEQFLRRTKDTDAQQALDAKARKGNLRTAFSLTPDSAVKGRHLALIDDVLTTGATAQALARLLMNAGAARVDVYCLARTPKPGT